MNIHGIGLGLNLSKKIIEQFNGKIEVNSVYGKGSTFTFTFNLFDKIEEQSPSLDEKEENKYYQQDVDHLVFLWKPAYCNHPVEFVHNL